MKNEGGGSSGVDMEVGGECWAGGRKEEMEGGGGKV